MIYNVTVEMRVDMADNPETKDSAIDLEKALQRILDYSPLVFTDLCIDAQIDEEIGPDDWRRKLHPGDEITWNDPDDSLCSRTGVISDIRYVEDDAACVRMTDGWQSEVLLKELS